MVDCPVLVEDGLLHSQEYNIIDLLHFLTIHLKKGIGGLPGSPKIHFNLLGFSGVQAGV